MTAFTERLLRAATTNKSLICVGLDPDPSLMPIGDVLAFNKAIVDATRDLVCAYKPNLAFYEGLGIKGLDSLQKTVQYIHEQVPEVIIIGDAKRGDVESTSVHYAKALFEFWAFDAITVNPYLGGEALEPFFKYPDRGTFVLCRTSNPGAGEFQDTVVLSEDGPRPFYEMVAHHASLWNKRGNVGLVVGATYIEELKRVRTLCPGMPILIPGVGSQKGDLQQAVRWGTDEKGRNAIINSSRGVIYASRDRADFAEAARQVVLQMRDTVNRVLKEDGKGW